MRRTVRYKRKKKHLVLPFIFLIAAITLFALVCSFFRNYLDSVSPAQSSSSSTTASLPATSSFTSNIAATAASTVQKQAMRIQVPSSSLPENFTGFSWEIIQDGKILKEYRSEKEIIFPDSLQYNAIKGVTCFRGNNYRTAPSFGFADIMEEKLESVWFSTTGYIDIWTGVGWTGQPAIIQWDQDIKNKMNIFPEKKSKEDLVEVIYATLDGKIYFLDLEDGKPTRKPIDVGYTHKGSVAIDPRGYPLLYAGQGIPEKNGKKVPIGYRIYSLIDQKQLYFIDGYDKEAFRRWGAFDSGALIHAGTDTLLECGENGILYVVRLNTQYDKEKGTISIAPEMIKYRYHSPYGTKIGMENSPVIYRNYIYFADNSGLFQCVDLNTLKPVWLRNVTDDTDSTPVLEEVSENEAYLYTACEVDRQGKGGFSFIRKLNGLTGELVWEKKVPCAYDSNTNGGALASPVLGKKDMDDLILYNIAKTGKNNNGSRLLALDRVTGKEVWTKDLTFYCWSSPIDVYTSRGKGYLIVADSGGTMRLLDGRTGDELDNIPLEANVEASPAVFGDRVVVGTRGQKIWCIQIK